MNRIRWQAAESEEVPMKRTALALITIVALAAGFAAAKPNFTGEWKLNAAKSDFGEFPAPSKLTMTIGHDDPSLKVTTTMAGDYGEFTWEAAYTTDGKECINKMRDNESKSTVTWDGDTLLINTKTSFGDNDMTISDKWKLAADGKSLMIERKFSSSRGETVQKMTLEKP